MRETPLPRIRLSFQIRIFQIFTVLHPSQIYTNTRLEVNPFDEGKQAVAMANKAAANAQAKTGKIDVEGREVAAEETPQVNGFSFVATPSPMPGAEESPFMTWGKLK